MTSEERIAFQNLRKLVLNGRFDLTGIECLALAHAVKVLDKHLELPTEVPASSAGPLSTPIKAKKNGNK